MVTSFPGIAGLQRRRCSVIVISDRRRAPYCWLRRFGCGRPSCGGGSRKPDDDVAADAVPALDEASGSFAMSGAMPTGGMVVHRWRKRTGAVSAVMLHWAPLIASHVGGVDGLACAG